MKKHSITAYMVLFVILATLMGSVIAAGAYEHKSSDENNVRIEIIPEQLGPGRQAKFNIKMNTHSVELNQDMAAAAILKDDQGRKYRPLNWNGSPPGGHHRSGVLEFPIIGEKAKSVTLYIKDVADVPERIFEWKIER